MLLTTPPNLAAPRPPVVHVMAAPARHMPRLRNFAHHHPVRRSRPTHVVEPRLIIGESLSRPLLAQLAHGEDALGTSVAKAERWAVLGGHGRHGPGARP